MAIGCIDSRKAVEYCFAMGTGSQIIDSAQLEQLITEAKASGGSEMANYQLFIIGLTDALGLTHPKMAGEENQFNDYVFERRVDFNGAPRKQISSI